MRSNLIQCRSGRGRTKRQEGVGLTKELGEWGKRTRTLGMEHEEAGLGNRVVCVQSIPYPLSEF